MIKYHIPYVLNKNLKEYYNSALEECTSDWICFVDGDTCFTTPFYGKIIQKIVDDNRGKYALLTCMTNRTGTDWQLVDDCWENDSMSFHRNKGLELVKTFGSQVENVTGLTTPSGHLMLLDVKKAISVGGFKGRACWELITQSDSI